MERRGKTRGSHGSLRLCARVGGRWLNSRYLVMLGKNAPMRCHSRTVYQPNHSGLPRMSIPASLAMSRSRALDMSVRHADAVDQVVV
jgi:hypothetical protein